MLKSEKKPTKKQQKNTREIRNGPLLEYDASTVYNQLGYATQAVEACHIALYSLMDDVVLTTEETELGKALGKRAKVLAKEAQEILRSALHLKSSRSKLQRQMLSNACEATRITLLWFTRFLSEHSHAQKMELKPVTEEMEVAYKTLQGLKKMKAEDAAVMEKAAERENRKKRKEATKKVSAKKTSNISRTTPDFELQNEDTTRRPPQDSVNVEALFDAAVQEIKSRE